MDVVLPATTGGGVVVVPGVTGSTQPQADEIFETVELQAAAYVGSAPVNMVLVKVEQKAEAWAGLAPLKARPQLSEQAALTATAPKRPTAWASWRRRIVGVRLNECIGRGQNANVTSDWPARGRTWRVQ